MDMAAGSVAQEDTSSLSRLRFCLGIREQELPDGILD